MYEPLITVVGHVAGPPTQRATSTGVAVADFRMATTPRRKDKATGTWSDGETIWFGVTTWRLLAQHCTASLKKGDRVVVTGRLTTRSYEVEGGERKINLELDARTVGLDLSKAQAAYQRPAGPVTDSDPWVSSGMVDKDTGEVRALGAPGLAPLDGSAGPPDGHDPTDQDHDDQDLDHEDLAESDLVALSARPALQPV